MQEQRKANRFQLKLPIKVVRVGSQTMSATAETKNLSSLGVLFANDMPMVVGEPIEYVITLPAQSSETIMIRCLGKVVRHQTDNADEGLERATAATLERYEFVRSRD